MEPLPQRPRLSVVIPSGDASRDANVQLLIQDLRAQSLPPDEIEVVRGVSPNGRARNTGVERTTGEVLIFLDDDVRLGSPDILCSFVEHLYGDSKLGMVGTSQLLPPDSSRFQQACARQIHRRVSPVVDVITDSDMVATACCAMRRSVLEEVGGFHDKIIRGVDNVLRYRVRQAGHRIVVIPQAWHYHPVPASWRELWRTAWRDGSASAYARKHFPEALIFSPVGHEGTFEAHQPLPRRVLRNAGRLCWNIVTGRWCGMVYYLAYACGNLAERG